MPPTELVLATDLSSRCDRALDRALALAAAWRARLTLVHALEPPAPVEERPSWQRGRDRRDRAAGELRAMLPAPLPDGATVAIVVEWARPAELVLETAARRGAGLIVTGVVRDDTLARAALGTTLDALVRGPATPVLVVKARRRRAYRDVVVATDFSEGSRHALETALALFPDAAIRLFHAYRTPYESLVDDKASARAASQAYALHEAEALLAGVATERKIATQVEHGGAADLLGELVEAGGADLVVVGTRGRGRVAKLLLGSVAGAVVATVPGDVLVVGCR